MTETYAGDDDPTKSWWYFIGRPHRKEEEWKSEEEYRKENENK